MTKVIALENPPAGRRYGEEFDQPEGSALTTWLLEKRYEAEEGQGTIEYVLVLGVIVVGIFGLVQWGGLGTAITNALTAVTDLFDPANNPIS